MLGARHACNTYAPIGGEAHTAQRAEALAMLATFCRARHPSGIIPDSAYVEQAVKLMIDDQNFDGVEHQDAWRRANRVSSTPPAKSKSRTLKPLLAGSLPNANGPYDELR